MTVGIRSLALSLAGSYPAATLACPACDAGVKGANLARHLEKVHPVVGGASWAGLGFWGGQLAVIDGALELRRFLRPTWRIPLPAAVACGPARVSRSDVIDTSLGLANPATHDEGAGTCLHIGAGGDTIVVRCASGSNARRHWVGFTAAPGTRSWQITLSAADFAALQYALAGYGMLRVNARDQR